MRRIALSASRPWMYHQPNAQRRVSERTLSRLLLILVVALAALHFPLIFRLNINWDEFRFLADVYSHQSGTLVSPLQTLHVHVFRWLPGAGVNEVDQIIAARFVYYCLLLGSCGLVYAIARQFLSVSAALFVVVCYLSYSEVVIHATSFRFDGLAVFLLLASVAILFRTPSLRIAPAVSGMLGATAILISLKSVFYIPTLVLILLLRGSRDRTRDLVVFSVSIVCGLAVLYAAHRTSLAPTGLANPADILQQAGSRVIRFDAPFPRARYLGLTVMANLVTWYCLVHGTVITVRQVLNRDQIREGLLLLALLVPLASLVIYRNAFPYFYVFLMPPILVFAGIPFDRLVAKMKVGRRRAEPALALILILGVVGTFASHYSKRGDDETEVQRAIVEAVHYIFPRPVPYIDRNSMIASFPKGGFFMSTWGFESYMETGKPVFEGLLRTQRPRFLIANHPALILDANTSIPRTPGRYRLFDEDFRILSDNFVPHWGPIFVAGKRVNVAASKPMQMEILIPGVYTIESVGNVSIDSLTYQPGDTIALQQGWHDIQSTAHGETITLRWGVRLPRPIVRPPVGILYRNL